MRGAGAEIGDDAGDRVGEIEGHGAKLQTAGIERRAVDEIVHQVNHPERFGAHGAGEGFHLIGLRRGRFEEVGG